MEGERAVDAERLAEDLRALGLREGNDVLVHSSLSRIGWVTGGATAVVEAVVRAVGPEGTALFPAHTGHPGISPASPPIFDVRRSPSLGIGVVPEAARRYPGARRSLQPTPSVTAVGARAGWYVEGHEACDTPCGAGSPYEKLSRPEVGGRILLLGCNHNSNTSIHMVEELGCAAYHLLPGEGVMRITDEEGRERLVPGRFHRWGVERDFMRLDGEMTHLGIQTVGIVGEAESRLVKAPEMREFMLRRLAEDPGILLPEVCQPPSQE